MPYQDCSGPAPAAETASPEPSAQRLADANINPATGLATDYLNHFYEAIMLLEMLPGCPDCRDDILAWRPLTYREHFAASAFSDRALAIAASETVDAAARGRLEALTAAMSALIEDVRAALLANPASGAVDERATRAAARLRPLAAQAAALITGAGDAGAEAPQALIDGLMNT